MTRIFLLFALFLASCDEKHIIYYLNFDGGSTPGSKRSLPSYESPYKDKASDELLILQALRQRFSSYRIEFTIESTEEEHNTIIFTQYPSDAGLNPEVLGTAPLDCQNQSNTDVIIIFTKGFGYDPNDQSQYAKDIGATTAHEIGHSLSLEHSNNPDDLMYSVFRRGQEFGKGVVPPPDICGNGPIQDSPGILKKMLN